MVEHRSYWQQVIHRQLSRRTLLRMGVQAGAGLALGSALIGCNNQPKAATTVTGEEPQTGGILTGVLAGDPPDFDLISSSTYMTHHPIAPIYNNLIMHDPQDPSKIVGDLAEKWEASSDGKSYTFHLVKGAKFHDGKPFTSADVKYTFDTIRNPPKGVVSARKGMLDVVDGIETPDDYTVRFVLKRPSPSLLGNLASGWMAVMPKHILQEKGDMKKDAIGTGPFKLKEYSRGNFVELVKNPDYHVKGRPYLDGLKFFIIPDQGTAFANFRTGQIHFYNYGLTGQDARRAKAEFGDKVEVAGAAAGGFVAVLFNAKRKPWDNASVRQAVSLAVDRSEAIKVVVDGDGEIGGCMLPGGQWALPSAELEKIPGYSKDYAANLAASKRLMAEAGYANGFSTTLLIRKGSMAAPYGVLLKEQLGRLGIDAKLDIQDSAAAYDSLNNRAFDVSPYQMTAAEDDPDAVFGGFYTCSGERNYSSLCNKDIDDLFDKQSQMTNADERKKLVNQMEKAALLTFISAVAYYPTNFVGLSRRVRGYRMTPGSIYNNQRLQDAWLAKT